MLLLAATVFALLVWWLSTGLVLRAVDERPAQRSGVLVLASLALGLGITGVVLTRDLETVAGAYLGFMSALLVWSWQELTFLMGLVIGPNRKPCPPVTGWRRAWFAFTAIAHHEIALVLLGLAVWLPSIGAPNQVAAQVFAVLWVMRLSAKLNIFLGVKNFYESFLPQRLHYLLSYFTRRRFNPLFPFSIVISTVAAVLIWQAALRASSGHETVAMGLVGSLLVLAIIEHWLLMLPMQPDALWRWALRSPRA